VCRRSAAAWDETGVSPAPVGQSAAAASSASSASEHIVLIQNALNRILLLACL
jgi:hypothetical protein